MTFDSTKAPFPWFGGKSKAASVVWRALGDVGHYVEPFAGSLAVLLNRPHEANRAYHSETVNDADGLLVNAWRSVQLSPDATAEACSWPVTEADRTARHLAIVRWRDERNLERLLADPLWHDPLIGGWWLYGICASIGGGWCAGTGPWIEVDGRLVKQGRGKTRGPKWMQGLADDEGREPGVNAGLPHLHDNGKGVHSAGLRANTQDLVMPKLLQWFRLLSARLRHVRIVNGDWERVCTKSAAQTLSCDEKSPVGIFLDPPYGDVRDAGLYAVDTLTVASEVRAWCETAPPHWRIVLAGFDAEGGPKGWRSVEWFKKGFLTGGFGNLGASGHQMHRERLWLSPACITEDL